MAGEWQRFIEVTEHVHQGRRLFRSSAPNYAGKDDTQNLTQAAVDFLVSKGINSIISFNEFPYGPAEIALLDWAGTFYRHFSVPDRKAPLIEQLLDAIEVFRNIPDAATLVHCGYGHGRTGTGVTALQLFATWGEHPLENLWAEVNRVEEEVQLAVLRELRNTFL